ncbi:DUF1488 family protein [Oxalobacteraceae bacterium CAVE-383]|nr:DUF1488 family protein [Oxalobacteraceae bacterium CAVE-383]
MTVELLPLPLQQPALPLSPKQHASQQGIIFSIRIEGTEHSCLIADCALKRLYAFEGTTLDIQHVYQAYQPKIHHVARNLILSGKSEPLLVLRAPHFTSGEA